MIQRLIVNGKIRQPDQPFGIMVVRALRLHQIATEEVIDGWKSAGDRMAPGAALRCGKPHTCELRRDTVHSDLGKDQHVRSVTLDGSPPVIERQRTLHETIAETFRNSGLGIPFTAGVVAGHMKSSAIQLLEPTFERNL